MFPYLWDQTKVDGPCIEGNRVLNGRMVTVVYRRDRKAMPADPDQVRAMFQEGIELLEWTLPEAIEVKYGAVAGMRCARMKANSPRRAYIERIEGLVGSPIDIISMGADRRAAILRSDVWEG